MRNGYWKCEFEGKNGKTNEKTIYAKTSHRAVEHTCEMSMRINMTPKYETLREATDEEAKKFKKLIKKRIKANKT